MNLTTRIEKLEAKLEEIIPKEDQVNYPIQYKRDERGVEYYHLRRDGEWSWVIKEELDKFLAKFQERGMLIFVPEQNKE